MLQTANSTAALNSNSVGQSIDESFVHNKKSAKTIGESKNKTIFEVLNSKTKRQKKSKSKNKSGGEIFNITTVNQDVITNLDIVNYIKLIFFLAGKDFDKTAAKLMVRPVMESLKNTYILRQCARLMNMEVTDEEVMHEIDLLLKDNEMTLSEFEEHLQNAGITLETYKEYMRNQLTLPTVIKALVEDSVVSNKDIDSMEKEMHKELNSKRYRIVSMFFKKAPETKNNAQQILKLMKEGFSPVIMAKTLSQDRKKSSDPKWRTEDSLELPIRNAIKKLNPGELSEVIETNDGYVIVYVMDKAEPGKEGILNKTYKILRSFIKFDDPLATEAEKSQFFDKLDSVMETKSHEEFKEVCKKHKFEVEELNDLIQPNPFYAVLINRSKESKTPAILQSPGDNNLFVAVYYKSEHIGNVKKPTSEEIKERASIKKKEKDLREQIEKLESFSHITTDQVKLSRVFS